MATLDSVPVILSTGGDELAPPLTFRQMAWRRFRRHRMAMFGAIVLIMLFVYAFAGGLIYTAERANFTDTTIRLSPPSLAHPFGTDTVGRDVMARTIQGGRISLMIGLTAAFLEILIGVLIGAAAGFYGGVVDSLLMRFTEAMLIIPSLFLLIVMARIVGGSVFFIVIILGLTSWMYVARIVRAEFLSLKQNDYILAARSIGTPTRDIIFRHILPNSMAPIVVAATLAVATAILSEAYISFLGMGVQPPTATWGNMLDGSYNYIESAPWLWIFPGLLILLTVLSINFVGDGLRDALDPRSRNA
ncbi:MAG: ABC transporter permease [Anaerolineales bacterium]|uniref:ABC transporter permease n=1 Tax=Promineifilum sp. TaxID=2664178 RepID=UPI001E055902|nr:ABC transporter permease [Anaerolineales bacterium]MCO5180290.1 ABC transporter permease [Promineifilum sp.]